MADYDSEPESDTESDPKPTLGNLPNEIIIHILSFLPTLDSISTSLISRKFRPLWSLTPSLFFSFSQFPPYNSLPTTRRFFAQFTDRTLILRPPSPLLSFRLDFSYHQSFCCHVDSWIRYALRNQTRSLSLTFHYEVHDTYDFPFSFLRESNLSELDLCNCYLTLPNAPMRLGLLKSVRFCLVHLTDQMVSSLMEWCPNLEEFRVENTCGVENLRIWGSKLRVLEMIGLVQGENELSLDLHCPNLVELMLSRIEMGRFVVGNLQSLVDLRVLNVCDGHGNCWFWRGIGDLAHVKRLWVQNWWFKLGQKGVFSRHFVLYGLKDLKIYTGYSQAQLLGLAELLALSPNLETMTLICDPNLDEDVSLSKELLNKPITLNMPCLREVKMSLFNGTKEQLEFVILLKNQGIVLEKIVMVSGNATEPTIIFHRRPPMTGVIEESPSSAVEPKESVSLPA